MTVKAAPKYPRAEERCSICFQKLTTQHHSNIYFPGYRMCGPCARSKKNRIPLKTLLRQIDITKSLICVQLLRFFFAFFWRRDL
ncbi:MAG: hypothetical protein ACTSQI_07710 [Candidatus Helarchaeota archaeon]